MLEINDLRFRYSAKSPEVLKGISFTLNKGEIGILLGKNGAGKTTLFKTLVGIERPFAGTVTLDGTDLMKLKAAERAKRIAYVPQSVSFGGLSVFDTVMTGRMPFFGMKAGKDDREAVEKTLKEAGLYDLKDRFADRLSGGEKQKVAVARALAGEPGLIVFDEPAGNLDLANERRLLCQMKTLARERGVSILCSLHGLNEAAELGDRFFFMKDGAIRHDGGKELFTENVIEEIYGVKVRILHAEGRTLITGKDEL